MSDPPAFDVESSSVADTEAAAGRVADRLRSGGIVTLVGGLGAGKTQFTRGLVAALGGEPRDVHSPTYVLLHRYPLPGGRSVWHLDAYRGSSADDFEAIGLEEIVAATQQGDVLVIEWPDRVVDLLPADVMRIEIEHVAEDERLIRVLP